MSPAEAPQGQRLFSQAGGPGGAGCPRPWWSTGGKKDFPGSNLGPRKLNTPSQAGAWDRILFFPLPSPLPPSLTVPFVPFPDEVRGGVWSFRGIYVVADLDSVNERRKMGSNMSALKRSSTQGCTQVAKVTHSERQWNGTYRNAYLQLMYRKTSTYWEIKNRTYSLKKRKRMLMECWHAFVTPEAMSASQLCLSLLLFE